MEDHGCPTCGSKKFENIEEKKDDELNILNDSILEGKSSLIIHISFIFLNDLRENFRDLSGRARPDPITS